MMSSVRILLLAQEGETRERYKLELERLGVAYDMVSTLEELEEALTKKGYNGILTDVVARTRGDAAIKRRLHYVLETDLFPVMRLKWNPQKDIIHTLSNRPQDGDESVAGFIQQHCLDHQGRPIRASERVAIHFNLTLYRPGQLTHTEPTVTVDVSRGGAYINSQQRWKVAEEAQFIVKEFKDRTPIVGEVRWQIPWGKAMKFPGFGVRFTQISEEQIKELAYWTKSVRS